MEIIFLLGLLGLLGAWFFIRGYAFLLDDARETLGLVGLLVGLLPPLQWLYALANPRRGLAPLASQVLGLLLMTPGAALFYVFSGFFNVNLRFG